MNGSWTKLDRLLACCLTKRYAAAPVAMPYPTTEKSRAYRPKRRRHDRSDWCAPQRTHHAGCVPFTVGNRLVPTHLVSPEHTYSPRTDKCMGQLEYTTNSNLSRHLEVTAISNFPDEVPLSYRTSPATVLFLFEVLRSCRCAPTSPPSPPGPLPSLALKHDWYSSPSSSQCDCILSPM
jgi:hypothetical protein